MQIALDVENEIARFTRPVPFLYLVPFVHKLEKKAPKLRQQRGGGGVGALSSLEDFS